MSNRTLSPTMMTATRIKPLEPDADREASLEPQPSLEPQATMTWTEADETAYASQQTWREALQLRFMGLAEVIGIDVRNRVRESILRELAYMSEQIAQSAEGQKEKRQRERSQEAAAVLAAKQSAYETARQRHLTALASENELELNSARDAVVESRKSLDLYETEYQTISRALNDVSIKVAEKRASYEPHMKNGMTILANSNITETVEKLWAKLNQPEFIALFEELSLHAGLLAIARPAQHMFQQNIAAVLNGQPVW